MTDRFQTAVLCEHITKDISNKHSLIGVFSGDIIVAEMPAKLRLALYVEVLTSSIGQHDVTLKFNLGGKTVGEAIAQADIQDAKQPLILALFPIEILVDVEAALTVEVTTGEGKVTTIIEKKIFKGDITPATS